MTNFENKGHAFVLSQYQKGQRQKRKLKNCPLI